ncbi:hypothetical protein ACIHCQ_39575 [Streptomyces sp. NPDC052236]
MPDIASTTIANRQPIIDSLSCRIVKKPSFIDDPALKIETA